MDYDEPLGQRLRAMTLLDCVPGRTKHSATGDPIAILTFSSKGEVEQPMAISLDDARRLAVACMAVVTTFTGKDHDEIVHTFFDGEPLPEEDNRIDLRELGRKLTDPSWSKVSHSAPEHVAIYVRIGDRKPIKMTVLGGYQRGRRTMLLVRTEGLIKDAPMSLARLRSDGRIVLKGHRDSDRLRQKEWPRLMLGPHVRDVFIKSDPWAKLSHDHLKTKLHGKTFLSVGSKS